MKPFTILVALILVIFRPTGSLNRGDYAYNPFSIYTQILSSIDFKKLSFLLSNKYNCFRQNTDARKDTNSSRLILAQESNLSSDTNEARPN